MVIKTVKETKKLIHKITHKRPTISRDDLKIVLDCLVDNQLNTGNITRDFENKFKERSSNPYITTSQDLLSAYYLSLLTLGVQEGDSVALSSFAPIQALDAIFLLKAKPVVIDIGNSSFHISYERLEIELGRSSVKTLIIDHTFGSVIDGQKFKTFGVPIIEDYSEVFSGKKGKYEPGSFGDLCICGLNSDHIITTGKGAIITTSNKIYFNQLLLLKKGEKNNRNSQPRLDYSMLDYQAALGIEQLSKIQILIERNRKIGQIYLNTILKSMTKIESYYQNLDQDTYNRFIIVIPIVSLNVEEHFHSQGIEVKKPVDEPIHKILELPISEFPNSERLFQKGFSIPIYPSLSKADIEYIIYNIKGIY